MTIMWDDFHFTSSCNLSAPCSWPILFVWWFLYLHYVSVGQIDFIVDSITDIIASCVVIGLGVNVSAFSMRIFVLLVFNWKWHRFYGKSRMVEQSDNMDMLRSKVNKLTDMHYLLVFVICVKFFKSKLNCNL